MVRSRSILNILTLTFMVLCISGCGKKATVEGNDEEMARQGEFAEVYDIYTLFAKQNERAPQKIEELTGEGDEKRNPSGVRVLKGGTVTVVWGVDVSNKDGSKVLAYEKDAPRQGGAVLMADGKIKKMSADDLKSALGQK